MSQSSEGMLEQVLAESHLMEPGDVPAVLTRAAYHLGVSDPEIYLVEPHQRELMPLLHGPEDDRQPLDIDTTLAGRAFLTGEVQDVDRESERQFWIPLIDGADRVGVFGVQGTSVDDTLRQGLLSLAGVITELVLTQQSYTDVYDRAVRRKPMSLAAEIQWGLLPPLNCTTRRVAVSGALEPAYDIGGDAFDYALNGDMVHLAIFDAIGHGLDATWPASLAVASIRHSRRHDLDLAETYLAADEALRSRFEDTCFVTAQLAQLDLVTARLRWISAGHPAPLLVRDRQVVASLDCAPSLPFGLGGKVEMVAETTLEPGDRILFFTDGVVEGRPRGGEPFGEHRLADAIQRESLADNGSAETMRRLAHAVLDHHAHELADDFTMLLVEYRGNGLNTVRAPLAIRVEGNRTV